MLLGLLLVAASCSRSSSPAPEVYGTATIGPAGGDLVVDSGPQAGLRGSVPPGALAAPTELRVVPASPFLPGEVAGVSGPSQPGVAFEIQPAGLRLELLAFLRAPYRAETGATSPWNVRLRRLQGIDSYEIDPTANDPVAGRVETPIRWLGRYQVVRGPTAAGMGDYRQPVGTTVPLADGYALAVEEVPPGSPFAGINAQRWRITGPGVEDLLYFDGDLLRGRESLVENWREVWSEPYSAWTFVGSTELPPPGSTTALAVSTPIGYPSTGGSMVVWGFATWSAPRTVADRLFCDVIQLNVSLAWDRADLGVGMRQYAFWFAPGVGLLGFAQDAVAHVRTSL